MRKYLPTFFIFSLFLSMTLYGEERIAGTLENVDLIIEDVTNEKGHNHGEKYFAFNRNHYPVRLTIRLTDQSNADDQLVPFTIIIKPQDRVQIGIVMQKNPEEESSWNYEWVVEPDQK